MELTVPGHPDAGRARAPRGGPGRGGPGRGDRGSGLPGAALTLIHTGQAPTRSALTTALRVTRATAGAVAAELRDLGLIEVDTGPPGGAQGRPSHRLRAHPAGPVALAAHIYPDGYTVALVGLGGHIVARTDTPADMRGDPAPALAPAAAAGAELLRHSGRACVGAAFALPTAISEPEGAAVSPLYLGWPTGTKVRDIITGLLTDQGLSVPCQAVNDVNAVALAEHRHGAGTGAAYLLVVSAEHRGVGAALVLRGALYTGSTGLSMEAGHVSVDPGGLPCPCGNRGCLNVETDAERFMTLSGRAARPDGPLLDQATAILAAEYESDPRVRAAAAALVQRLGLGLAGLINVLNPDRVLLGGLHKYLLEAAPDQLREAVALRSPWGRAAVVPIQPCALDAGGLIGAAERAWQPVLDDPTALAR